MFLTLCGDVKNHCDIFTILHFTVEQNNISEVETEIFFLTHISFNSVSFFLSCSLFSQRFLVLMGKEKYFHLSLSISSPLLYAGCASDVLREDKFTATCDYLMLTLAALFIQNKKNKRSIRSHDISYKQ